jgi:hypothetical protein
MEKRKMNKTKKAAVFASALAVFIALMSIAPVLAKPYNVTVIVKNADGTPATNVWVEITTSTGPTTNLYQVNSRGKVVIPITSDFQLYPECQALVFPSELWGSTLGSSTFYLNSKASARVTVTLFPPPPLP